VPGAQDVALHVVAVQDEPPQAVALDALLHAATRAAAVQGSPKTGSRVDLPLSLEEATR